MAKQPLRPGTRAPASGQYRPVGLRGGVAKKEITAVKGKPLPPTAPGGSFKIVDRTKNKSGQGPLPDAD